jgi:translation initiation factor 2 subunit 1
MLYRRSGMPEDDELVLCTITKIYHNSVFAQLDEYDKQGMIHISEVSPGRIRNIRDFVKEGKKVVCKVLRTDPVKGHIDLSVRRVNEKQRRSKMDEIKQEQKAEKLLEHFSKSINRPFKEIYEEVSAPVFHKYVYLHQCFKEVVEEKADLEKLGIEHNLAKRLAQVIVEKIKPEKVEMRGELALASYSPDGVDIIKQALSKAKGMIRYKGSGKYEVIVTAPDYKSAENLLQNDADAVVNFIKKAKGTGSFVKT